MNQATSPPKLADRFLKWYCHEDLLDEIQGDLYEQFHKNLKTKGLATAKRKFTLDVIRFFRPSSFKSTQVSMNTQIIANYIKVAFRVFKKEKAYTFTNVFGLALGITCSLFIYLWVNDELKYNQWPANVDGIHYVLVNQIESSGTIHTWRTTPQPLREVLQDKYPAIEKAAITNWGATLILKKGQEHVTLSGHYGSPELFEIFSIPFIQGDHQLLYKQPESIVINESSAARYFGDDWRSKNLIGQSITDKNNRTFTLAGIFENIPKHSTLKFDFIIPFDYYVLINPSQKHWGNYNHNMYVKLAPGYSTASANDNILNAISENRPDQEETAPLILQPFSSLYLYNKYEQGQLSGGRIDYVRLLSISAILILILAGVNFMNLTTAKSAKRSRETGIRKVMGAVKSSLRAQFLTEAILITLLAFILSAFFTMGLLPYFNVLAGKEIGADFFTPSFILASLGLILSIGFISGLYPAIYMASLHPILSLKGIMRADRSNALFRKGLVVFQFVITIVMIFGSITIYKQLQYVFSKNLGLDRENVIKMGFGDLNPQTFEIYKERLLQMPGIKAVAASDGDPTNIGSSTSDPYWTGRDEHTDVYFNILGVNPDFIPLMSIQLKEGRNFDRNIASDSNNYLINEVSANIMGFDNPIGQDLEFWGQKGKIIGVTKNFHIQSLHAPYKPLIIRMDPEPSLMLIKTKSNMTQEAIASMETLHKEFQPDRTFDFTFMDKAYNDRYKSELLVSQLTLYFTIVAIVISCLGLLSLVSFNTEVKTKEIGIRKVMGASTGSILSLIGKEFLMLVFIAIVLASPLAYFIMQDWLNQFAFRIDLDLSLFLMAGMSGLLLTILTIGHHTLQAALRNPADSLRDE